MSTIHGRSTKAIKLFRDKPAALAVYWIYCARRNHEGIAYPSVRGLMADTGCSTNPVYDARSWLVEHKALEKITDEYVRPEWRTLPECDRKHLVSFDKAEYYRVTGYIMVDEKRYDMLYAPASDADDVSQQDTSHSQRDDENKSPDVSLHETSDVSPGDTQVSHAAHDAPDDTELDSSSTQLENNAASENEADGVPEIKIIKRSEMFVAVAGGIFEIFDTTALDKKLVVLVNKVVRWLRENSPGAKPETIKAFSGWYKNKFPGAALPQDETKFAKHFMAFKQQHLNHQNGSKSAPPAVPAPVHLTDDEKQQRREMREAAQADLLGAG